MGDGRLDRLEREAKKRPGRHGRWSPDEAEAIARRHWREARESVLGRHIPESLPEDILKAVRERDAQPGGVVKAYLWAVLNLDDDGEVPPCPDVVRETDEPVMPDGELETKQSSHDREASATSARESPSHALPSPSTESPMGEKDPADPPDPDDLPDAPSWAWREGETETAWRRRFAVRSRRVGENIPNDF